MILTLEVLGEQAEALGAGHRKVFHAIGGTIGRLPDNDWVLPDPYISGRHALIRYRNGKYFIEDTSTNGVFLNAPGSRAGREQPCELKHGDRLFIDAYEIRVSIEKDPAAARDDPFASFGQRAAPRGSAAAPEEDRTANLVRRDGPQGSEDQDDDTGPESGPESQGDDGVTEWFGMNEVSLPKHADLRASRSAAIRPVPDLPKPLPRRTPPPPRSAAGNPPARPPVDGDSQLLALLAAAGVEGLDPSSEAARTLGEMLRVAVKGIMEVLRARERMKDELGMRGTGFKVAHNNPLKFSANVEDAFHNLLVKHNPAYLGPGEAFEAALRDVRDHHVALPAALRVAFESMLAQFDPEQLQHEFERQPKGAIIGVPAKLRYWELYRDKYGELSKDAAAGFRQLFADKFAAAYEEQLERVKLAERHRSK
jgi:type VI secretion system FHA domain protein